MIYLDHNAATPLCPDAREALGRLEELGNPSSIHAAGRKARAAIELTREQVRLQLDPNADVILTAGGTEACNLGVLSLMRQPTRVVTTQLEHPAVVEPIAILERQGARVIRLPLRDGRLDTSRVTLDSWTLVAVQHVNHETGHILPLRELVQAARAANARVFVDATQAAGKVTWDFEADAVAISGAKLGGPSGSGALLLRRGIDIEPRLVGGAQERGRRAGSLPFAPIVGMGAAVRAVADRRARSWAIRQRRDRIEAAMLALGGVSNFDPAGERVPHVANVSFPVARGDALVAALDLEGVCVSSGAACSSGLSAPSPVILALWPHEPWRAANAIRVSLGPETTDAAIGIAIAAFERVMRRFAPAK